MSVMTSPSLQLGLSFQSITPRLQGVGLMFVYGQNGQGCDWDLPRCERTDKDAVVGTRKRA